MEQTLNEYKQELSFEILVYLNDINEILKEDGVQVSSNPDELELEGLTLNNFQGVQELCSKIENNMAELDYIQNKINEIKTILKDSDWEGI